MVRGNDIPVEMTTDLGTLRAMVVAADQALKYWPGGDPQEQVNLMKMRSELYSILMSVLLENGLV